ncbi:hypothetical protein K466DRAFT_519692 [Polyporus arcularius HHB13444]|uniref:BTB domain-containing protein n=1 Tax=Polyporus arcularius HHB13444 TaxID=1314778 RepID=A0A5C3PIC5_9APHY|nr:hypothetical protein K466DRAFT_519692 [Polyporus arcularius HHB13444]
MPEPSRKRPRTSDEDVAPVVQLPSGVTKKDDEFWFDDGNLIIVAQDVEFRIYRGPLVKHSPVFRDMLTLPQPADARDLSCAVVHISEHPISFKHLLREFMTGNACRLPDDKPAFEAVSAIVRLGHKYELDSIVKKGLTCLEDIYPNEFRRWTRSLRVSGEIFAPVSQPSPRCISVVNIARLTDTPSLLRPALVECCELDPKELMAGYRREEGVVEQLSADDLARVLLARAELIRLDALAALRIFQGVSTRCKDPAGCARTFRDALWNLTKPGAKTTFGPMGRRRWSEYVGGLRDDYVFCTVCRHGIYSQESEERQNIWELLPSILDIPEMPTLGLFD